MPPGWAKYQEEDGTEYAVPLAAWALIEGVPPVATFGDRAVIGLVADDEVTSAEEPLAFREYVYAERYEDLDLRTGQEAA